MSFKVNLVSKVKDWKITKNYNPDEVVKFKGKFYQNKTGVNTPIREGEETADWFPIPDSSSQSAEGSVLYSEPQMLTDLQKSTARNNIGSASVDEVLDISVEVEGIETRVEALENAPSSEVSVDDKTIFKTPDGKIRLGDYNYPDREVTVEFEETLEFVNNNDRGICVRKYKGKEYPSVEVGNSEINILTSQGSSFLKPSELRISEQGGGSVNFNSDSEFLLSKRGVINTVSIPFDKDSQDKKTVLANNIDGFTANDKGVVKTDYNERITALEESPSSEVNVDGTTVTKNSEDELQLGTVVEVEGLKARVASTGTDSFIFGNENAVNGNKGSAIRLLDSDGIGRMAGLYAKDETDDYQCSAEMGSVVTAGISGFATNLNTIDKSNSRPNLLTEQRNVTKNSSSYELKTTSYAGNSASFLVYSGGELGNDLTSYLDFKANKVNFINNVFPNVKHNIFDLINQVQDMQNEINNLKARVEALES